MEGTFLALRHISADILQIYPHLTVRELDEIMAMMIDSLGGDGFSERLARLWGELETQKQLNWIEMAIADLCEVVAVDLIHATREEREKVVAEFILSAILCPPPGTPRFSELLDRVRRGRSKGDKVFALEGKKRNLPDPISAAVKQLEKEIAIALPSAIRSELEFVAAQLIGEAIRSVAVNSPSFQVALTHVRQSQGGQDA